MTIDIAILAIDDCVGSSVHGPADLFNAANLISRQMGNSATVFQTRIHSIDAQAVKASSGHIIQPDHDIAAAANADAIIIPGFGVDAAKAMERQLENLQPVIRQLEVVATSVPIITASCTGTFLLAAAGLLDGKSATTTWWLEEVFRQHFPEVELMADQILIDQGQVITAAAGTSYLDLGLHLINRLAGPQLARLCARYMVVDGGRKSQRTYTAPTHFMHRNKLIEKADGWIRHHASEKISVESLAEFLGVSSRTLIRRIRQHMNMTPQTFIRRTRMELAKNLLETTPDTIASIGAEVGYEDENAFRRSFTNDIDVSPSQYRSRFKSGSVYDADNQAR